MTNKYTMMDKLRNYILARSCKFEQVKKEKRKTVNLRIAVPPLTDRGSSINSKQKSYVKSTD